MMKMLLTICFAGLLVLSLVAHWLTPRFDADGRTSLVWVTDPNPQRDDQVGIFNQRHPEFNLRIDPDNTGVMKVVVQCSAGMGPDLIDHINLWNFQTYLEAGILWDITEQARAMGFGPETLHETVRPLVMIPDPLTGELRQYFYPCNVAHNFIIYNKDHFDEAGLSYPGEDFLWEDYVEVALELTRYPAGGGVIPERFGAAGTDPLYMIWGRGGDLLNADGTRSRMGDPESVAGMQFWHDLFFKYRIEPTPSQRAGVASQGGWMGGSYFTWFGEGKVSMFVGSRWMLIQLRRQFSEQLEMKQRWEEANPGRTYPGVTPPRMGAVAMPRFRDGNRYTTFGARNTGVNVMSPHREDALRFMQFLAGPEYSLLINEGADSKPGNVAHADLAQFLHPDWPGEEAIHRVSIESYEYGRIIPFSAFISMSLVRRIFDQAMEQVRANPGLAEEEIARIMMRGGERIDQEIARNIARNPHLRTAYERMLSEGAEPAALLVEARD
jgi:multiple sugar transport system substrate-binding protein